MLSSFTIENYRAFAREQNIEVRPLTLFFGWNSGGKSALIRFLPLLVESIKADGPAVWLGGEVARDATWPELVCKATKRTNLKFELHWVSPASSSAKWEVDGDLAGTWQEVRQIELSDKSGTVTYGSDDKKPSGWAGYPYQVDVKSDEPDSEFSTTLRDSLRDLVENVQWIAGLRVRPPRLANYGGGNSPLLKSDGSNAVSHLVAAQLRSVNDPVLETVGQFFSALGDALVLDNPMDGAWRIMLRPSNAPDVKVNLCDTGEGYAQVLPVLVALARAQFGGPRLLCLEQPELHLHTRAQAELAKVLVATATSPSKPCILLETHSEVLLTSIQLAIARGDICPSKVRVYWVESRTDGTSDLFPVDFDSHGLPTNTTLVGAFREAVELGRELMVAQLKEAMN
ncbi:AAA family ATPase [Oxalobacteraceae bacterium]|nr:AAA family ATPase [Oxalobacteraceae bacterium]